MVDNQSWSIVIFAFNEEASIANVFANVLKTMEKIAPGAYEVILVNDGSTDSTLSVIDNIIKDHTHIKVVSNLKNMGIGKALLCGYAQANNENICAIPADGQFDIKEIEPYAAIPSKTLVSFYRTQKTRYSLFRKLLSFSNKSVNYYLLGIKIKDVNWVKIYKKEFFDTNKLILTSSLVESEICAKMIRNNYNVIEVPSKYCERTGGFSKGNSFKIIAKSLSELIHLCLVLRH
jgi:dolichol-phosphate mannosyltransferase